MRFAPGVRGARLLVRRRRRPARVAGARPPLLARLRVRTKLMLLVLPPVAGLLAFTVLSAMAQWNEARTLKDFKASTEVSFATAGFYEAVARERLAEVLAEAAPDRADTAADRDAARRATDRALTTAEGAASGHEGQPDVSGVLGSVDNQLHAVRLESGGGALTAAQIEQRYATVATYLLDTVRRLDSGRPTRASGRAGDAYLAVLGAIEASERERAALAALLATHHPDGQDASADRWSALEAAQLDTFRQTASGPLRAGLAGVLLQPAGRTVRATRETLLAVEGAQPRLPSLERWLTASGDRLTALRGIAHDAAGELAADADQGLKAAQARGERELALSVGVLFAVTVLALVLGRSISRPLSEVSEGAKALAEGDLSYDVHYKGRDEIGVVADTFRELHVTSERLAAEIRTMSTAIDDNRLGHRADVAAFDGTWAQLLGGMNGTMASFAAAHGRRRMAERELASIFHLSLDLLCICGTDGYFKRLNPAFERTLGHPAGTLLAKPWLEFVHPADRARTRAVLDRLENGAESAEFENRCLRADGTERWLQWSARPVRGEGLIYAAARDVTESRRADREQAALRRVATLVARGDPPHEVFAAVAREVGMVLSTGPAAVLRYEADGAVTVLGSADADTGAGEEAAAEVAHTGGPARAGRSVGAPIVVNDRLWGAVVAASTGPEPLPPGTESRLADFTELVATAIANADSQAQLRASRARGGRFGRVAAPYRARSARRCPAAPRLAPAGPADGRVDDGGPIGRCLPAVGAHRQGPRRRLRGPAADLPRHPPRDPLQRRSGTRPASPRPPLRGPRGAGSPAAPRPPSRTDRGRRLLLDLRMPHQRRQARARHGRTGGGADARRRPGGDRQRRRERWCRPGRRLRSHRARGPRRGDRRQARHHQPTGKRHDPDRTAAAAGIADGCVTAWVHTHEPRL